MRRQQQQRTFQNRSRDMQLQRLLPCPDRICPMYRTGMQSCLLAKSPIDTPLLGTLRRQNKCLRRSRRCQNPGCKHSFELRSTPSRIVNSSGKGCTPWILALRTCLPRKASTSQPIKHPTLQNACLQRTEYMCPASLPLRFLNRLLLDTARKPDLQMRLLEYCHTSQLDKIRMPMSREPGRTCPRHNLCRLVEMLLPR